MVWGTIDSCRLVSPQVKPKVSRIHYLFGADICLQGCRMQSCISAGLPKTEANWQDVISDLKRIEDLIQSIHVDATLYTESDAHPNCKVTAMKCFLLELHVILHESRNEDIKETVENLIILANSSLSSNGNVTESGCKECEELEEKNIKEFLQSFVHIVQMFINLP
uniref:Interleukin n=1 Tax=Equus caballus TaxID=9796 RepID=A0A5F5PSQ6_HORSE